jgi:hypothetical protein
MFLFGPKNISNFVLFCLVWGVGFLAGEGKMVYEVCETDGLLLEV